MPGTAGTIMYPMGPSTLASQPKDSRDKKITGILVTTETPVPRDSKKIRDDKSDPRDSRDPRDQRDYRGPMDPRDIPALL